MYSNVKVAVYNNTFIARRPHFGCDLVMRTFREQFDRVGAEYIGSVSVRERNPSAKILHSADLVVVNGEGSFHHNHRNDIVKVAERFPSVLINTVFEDNKVSLNKFRFVSVRETHSAKLAGCKNVIPDIIFSSEILKNIRHKPVTGKRCRLMHYKPRSVTTMQTADKVLKQLEGVEVLDTESFHGIALATMLGIKIGRVYNGAGVKWKTGALLEDIQSDPNYVENARKKINSLFESLHTFC